MAFRTANPTLSDKVFQGYVSVSQDQAMTIQGTVNKTGILLLITIFAASYTWRLLATGGFDAVVPYLLGGSVGGLIIAIILAFNRTLAPYLAPVYAVLEGLMLGGISSAANLRYPGIVPQAVGLTFGTLFALLAAYKSGLIHPSENFKLGVVAATGGVAMLYLVSFGLSFAGISIPFIHSSGPIGILFSLGMVVLASLNLVLDFDFIESGAERGAPKFMEWYAAFGLLVTLVWLYIEILRLLSKLNRR